MKLSFFFLVALSVAACSAPAPQNVRWPENYSTARLVQGMGARYAATPARLAAALTTEGDRPGGSNKTARWEKRELLLAVTPYPGAYANDVAGVLQELESAFGGFGRRLSFCMRDDDTQLWEAVRYFNQLKSCANREADIELVMDATDRPKQGRRPLVPPVPAGGDELEAFWKSHAATINQLPTRDTCDFVLAVGSGGKGITGAAAIIRSRSQEVGSGHRHLCVATLTNALLGGVPVQLESSDLSAAYVPELLQLLYSDRLESGLERDQLTALLTEAAP